MKSRKKTQINCLYHPGSGALGQPEGNSSSHHVFLASDETPREYFSFCLCLPICKLQTNSVSYCVSAVEYYRGPGTDVCGIEGPLVSCLKARVPGQACSGDSEEDL